MYIEPAQIDETTQHDLVDAAKLALGKKYKINDTQCHHLIAMHRSYLTPRDVSIDFGKNEIHAKKAKEATKRYQKNLQKCGHIGEFLIETAVKQALDYAQGYIDNIEYDKKMYEKDGFPYPHTPKRGNPGDKKLRGYITQMAYWYEEVVGKKPAHGNNSIFPRVISACLAIFDESWIEKGPPYEIIKNVLTNPPTFYRTLYGEERWSNPKIKFN